MLLIDNLNDESNKDNNGNGDHPDIDTAQIRTSIDRKLDWWEKSLIVTLKI